MKIEKGYCPFCQKELEFEILTGTGEYIAIHSAHVEAYGNIHIVAFNNAHIVAFNNAHVEAYDNVKVEGRSPYCLILVKSSLVVAVGENIMG